MSLASTLFNGEEIEEPGMSSGSGLTKPEIPPVRVGSKATGSEVFLLAYNLQRES